MELEIDCVCLPLFPVYYCIDLGEHQGRGKSLQFVHVTDTQHAFYCCGQFLFHRLYSAFHYLHRYLIFTLRLHIKSNNCLFSQFMAQLFSNHASLHVELAAPCSSVHMQNTNEDNSSRLLSECRTCTKVRGQL